MNRIRFLAALGLTTFVFTSTALGDPPLSDREKLATGSNDPADDPLENSTHVAVIDIAAVLKHYGDFNRQIESLKREFMARYDEGKRLERERRETLSKNFKSLKPGSKRYMELEKEILRCTGPATFQFPGQRLLGKQWVKRETTIYAQCYARIVEEITRYCDECNIDRVLRRNMNKVDPKSARICTLDTQILLDANRNFVLYFAKDIDITDEIIRRLNARPQSRTDH